MNFYINKLSIIDTDEKEAVCQTFSHGINVFTSVDSKTGNFKGKSSILKSIFHSLGAEARFSKKWEPMNKFIYILNFNIDSSEYTIIRHDKLFKIFDSSKKQLFKTIKREELASYFKSEFGIATYLWDRTEKYILTPPVYNFLLNYMDQEKISSNKFNSFDKLDQFEKFQNNVIEFQLGYLTDDIIKLNIEKAKKNTFLKQKKEEASNYENMLGILERDFPLFSDDEIEKELVLKNKEYNDTVVELIKSENKISELSTQLYDYEKMISSLNDFQKRNIKENKEAFDKNSCPRCKTKLPELHYFIIRGIENIENCEFLKLTLDSNVLELRSQIDEITLRVKTYNEKIKVLESETINDNSDMRDIVKDMAQKEFIKKIKGSLDGLNVEVETIKKEISKLKKEIKDESIDRELIDEFYLQTAKGIADKYDLNGFDFSKIKKPTDKIVTDGSNNNLYAVLWLVSLLSTKYKFKPDAIKLPIVFDTPNHADLSNDNKTRLFKMFFEPFGSSTQIITSSIGFNENEYSEFKINVIKLNGEDYHLLTKEKYQDVIDEYNEYSK
jgi:predicted transcriptional regulator